MMPVPLLQFEEAVKKQLGIAGPVFPNPERFPGDMPVAFGGNLTSERLMLAYTSGLFPWYSSDEPVLWWAPDPRCYIDLDGWKPSRTLKKIINRGGFEITFNRDFAGVVRACAAPRNYCDETWITTEMFEAYQALHRLGYAQSVEVWRDGCLVGGLYGLAVNARRPVFFGESIFHKESNMGKVAMFGLIERLRLLDFGFLDCQMPNGPLMSVGAIEISRADYMQQLRLRGVTPSTRPGIISLEGGL